MTKTLYGWPVDRVPEALAMLRQTAALLPARVDEWLPDVGTARAASGESCEYPMKAIASGIDDVLASFDALQVAMGSEYSRHERFLTGRCHE